MSPQWTAREKIEKATDNETLFTWFQNPSLDTDSDHSACYTHYDWNLYSPAFSESGFWYQSSFTRTSRGSWTRDFHFELNRQGLVHYWKFFAKIVTIVDFQFLDAICWFFVQGTGLLMIVFFENVDSFFAKCQRSNHLRLIFAIVYEAHW